MPARLQCPACSAPLDAPAGHAATLRCPYCGTSVLLKEAKEAVERIAAGQPGALPARSRPTAAIGCAAAVLAVAVGAGVLAARRGADAPGPAAGGPPPVERAAAATGPAEAPDPAGAPAPAAFAEPVLEWGSEGTGAGRFTDARSVAVDARGRVYVAEYSGGRVQVFDTLGVFLTQWTADPKMPLLDLEADRGGTVYVVQSGRIRRYEGATGKPLGEVRHPEGHSVSDVSLALDGSLWAVTWPAGIVHLGPDGAQRRSIDAREAIGDDVSPTRVAVSGTGDLYVLDRWSGEVYRLDPRGRFVDRFGAGDGDGGRASPADVEVDGRGRVVVGDAGGGIRVFTPDGRHLGSFGSGVVFGIALTDRDEVYAADRNRHRVVKFRFRE